MAPIIQSSCIALLGLSALVLLGGCEPPSTPLKPLKSELQDSPIRSIHYSEIPNQVAIIGKLGQPLWKLVTIEGKWMSPGLEKPGLPPTFAVMKVNGQILNSVVEFDVVEPLSSPNTQFARSVEGEVWELRGVETGGFVGFSDEVDEELGLPPASHPPRGFLTRFCYMKASLISTD